jgi:hypothetical protein
MMLVRPAEYPVEKLVSVWKLVSVSVFDLTSELEPE